MKNVLLTGVTSKIGRAVIPVLLDNGFNVTGLCRHPEKYTDECDIEIIKHDLNDELKIDRDFEYIIHVASYVPYNFDNKDSFEKSFFENIRSINNLLRFSLKNNLQKIVFTSSVDVYGDSDNDYIEEDSNLNGISNYGISKIASEGLLNVYFHLYGIKSTIFRLSYVYGTGMGEDRFLKRVITDLKCMKEIELYNIDNVLNIINVKDVAFALVKALDGPCGIFNLSQNFTLGEYINSAKNVLMVPTIVNELKHSESVSRRYYSTKKLKSCFGWEPSISLSDGITQIVEDLK
ncbi:MAG: hypothetical protein BA863_12845 [Desulfovibrio sp. S3730MH75]|nr:MAG: hypothetical protein BA863_12845 [Desulfovibrio sp. S3730MH75]